VPCIARSIEEGIGIAPRLCMAGHLADFEAPEDGLHLYVFRPQGFTDAILGTTRPVGVVLDL
jgi:hypothetical protein